MNPQYVLVYGNVIDGFLFVGPFTSLLHAEQVRDSGGDSVPTRQVPTLARMYAPIWDGDDDV